MGLILKEAFRAYWANLYLIAAIALTVWVPANLFLSYAETHWLPDDFAQSLRWYFLLAFPFDVVETGAIVYVFHQWRIGRYPEYSAALATGLKKSVTIFMTWTLLSVWVWLGVILFIIPGIVLLVRYSLATMPIIVEGAYYHRAKARSILLTRGQRLRIFFLLPACLAASIALPMALFLPQLFFEQLNHAAYDLVVNCVFDIVADFANAVLFEFYWQARLRRGEIVLLSERSKYTAPAEQILIPQGAEPSEA